MKFFRSDMCVRTVLFCLLVSFFHTLLIFGVTHDTTPFGHCASRRGSVVVTAASELFSHPSSLPFSYAPALIASENVTTVSNCSSSSFFQYVEDPFSTGAVGELLVDLAVLSLASKNALPFGLEYSIPSRYLPSEFTRGNRLNSSEDDYFIHSRNPHRNISLKNLMEHKSGIRDPVFPKKLPCASLSSSRVGKDSFSELSLCANETLASTSMTSTDCVPTSDFFFDSLFEGEEGSQPKNMSLYPFPFSARINVANHSADKFFNASFPYLFSRTNIALVHFILERILEELEQKAVLRLHNENTSSRSTPTKWKLMEYLTKAFFVPLNMSNTFFLERDEWDSRPLNNLSCENVSVMMVKKRYFCSHFHHDLLFRNNTNNFSSIDIEKSVPPVCTGDYMLYTTIEDFNILIREVLLPFGLLHAISERYGTPFPLSLSSVPLILKEPQRISKDDDREDFNSSFLEESPAAPLSSLNESQKIVKTKSIPVTCLISDSDNDTTTTSIPTTAPSHFTSSNYIWIIVGVVCLIAGSAFVSYIVDHIVHPTPPTQPLLPEPDRGFNQRQSFSTHSSNSSLSGSFSSSLSNSFSNANEGEVSTGGGIGARSRAMGYQGNRSVPTYRDRTSFEEPIFRNSLSREPSLDEIRSAPFSSSFSLIHSENTNAGDPVYLNMYSK